MGASVIDFGIDWLTLTNTLSNSGHSEPLIKHFARQAEVTFKWGSMGYKGHQDKDKGIKYGSRGRKDGGVDEMLVMSGEGADVMTDGIRGILSYRATRLDMQITIQLELPDPSLADMQYERIAAEKKMGAHPPGRRQVSSVRSESGSTLYIGARRTGRKFFRFYDKSEAFGSPLGTIWRQEVQYGRELAQTALELYMQIKGDRAAVSDLVSAEFNDSAGFSMYTPGAEACGIKAQKSQKMTTLEAKLEWLRRCVRPTIATLTEHDLQDEAIEALGLSRAMFGEKVSLPNRNDAGKYTG